MDGLTINVEIDKEKFYELMENFKKENPNFVEVVRCKDCIYHENAYCKDHHTVSKTEVYCYRHEMRNKNNWFCADGERKKDD